MSRVQLLNPDLVEVPGLVRLRNFLRGRVIGQLRAIDSITRPLNMAGVGLLPEWKPLTTLFFSGPTGVGKTEMATALADFLYEREREVMGIDYGSRPLVKIDSGQFGGSLGHGVSQLIGAPAGYVGSKQETKGGVRGTKPLLCRDNFPPNRIMVLLFDEIEKAFGSDGYRGRSQEILSILLAILDRAELKNNWDEDGPVNFTRTIVIFTSNIGAEDIVRHSKGGIGYDDTDKGEVPEEKIDSLNEDIYKLTKNAFDRFFVPELRNRMDQLVVFRFLGRDDFRKIMEKELAELERSMDDKGITLSVSERCIEWILNHGIIREEGARSLQRFLLRKLVYPITIQINAGMIQNGDSLVIDLEDSEDRDEDPVFFKEE